LTNYYRCTVEILALDDKAIQELKEFLHAFNIAGGSVDYKYESHGHLDSNNEEIEEFD